MNFFENAVYTLKSLVRAINGYDDRSTWRDRQREKPLIYHHQTAFNRKQFLSTRLKVRPCNRQSLS